MSNITHLYHLSALDYVDASFLGGPWEPTYATSDMLVADGVGGDGGGDPVQAVINGLVESYVKALEMRRKMHTAGALFSGRQPIQNALVPGGVTTMYSTTYPDASTMTDATDIYGPFNATETKAKFKALIKTVGEFINQRYIPDVLTVAAVYGLDNHPAGALGIVTSPGWFTQGAGCKRFLAYGDYPTSDDGATLAVKRGVVDWSSTVNTTIIPFDQNNIVEFVNYSYYKYGALDAQAGLHPFNGKTIPEHTAASGYSWLKAPRYIIGATSSVVEVGPLARMIVGYAAGNPTIANDTYTADGGVKVGGNYTIPVLIDAALNAVLAGNLGTFPNLNPAPVSALAVLPSVLGRHAARALEAKFLCDSLYKWVDELVDNGQCYTYARVPKSIKTGFGLCEAPRGALGHWIKIEGRKVAKYQCVVPSTWNFSPRADVAGTDSGAVEASLESSNVGTAPENMILNILRVVHPFDCCIACAVHVVNPEGKEMLKFAIGPDGKATNIEVKE